MAWRKVVLESYPLMSVAKESAVQKSALQEPEATAVNGADGRKPGFLARWRREKEEWLDITGYLVDGLKTGKPVIVRPGATVLGHIVAPKIIVEGTVSGSTYGRDVEIAGSGHVLGDVFAIALRVNPGGQVHGWVSSINAEELERFLSTGTLIDEAYLLNQVESLNEKLDTGFLTRNETEVEALHLLQAELAAMLAARYEMEQDFEKRLAEMAGEAYSKINTLGDQLTAARGELAAQKKQLDETQETLRQQRTQIERQSNELSIARDLMTDQNQELGELRDLYNELRHKHNSLEGEKAEVDATLEATSKEKEALAARVDSLETAHRHNLQYQADQEDSLVRWQELAEVTEKKAAEMETQLQKALLQAGESSDIIDLLREQRRELEVELEKALSELRELQGSQTRPLADPQILVEATNRITELEADLAHAEQEYLEQLIWYKASLETSRSELEQAREAAAQQAGQMQKVQEEMAQLQAEMDRRQEMLAAQKESIAAARQEAGQWQTAVVDKEVEWRLQTDELHQTIILLKADKKNMQTTLRESQMQLTAAEGEINRYLQETRGQGERLAEIHARLVEREVQLKQVVAQLKQARQMIEKQNQAIKQMKEMAAAKIRALQVENDRLRHVTHHP